MNVVLANAYTALVLYDSMRERSKYRLSLLEASLGNSYLRYSFLLDRMTSNTIHIRSHYANLYSSVISQVLSKMDMVSGIIDKERYSE